MTEENKILKKQLLERLEKDGGERSIVKFQGMDIIMTPNNMKFLLKVIEMKDTISISAQ